MDTIEKSDAPKQTGRVDLASQDGQADQVTDELYLTKNGLKLFPQPVREDALDPLNWSFVQKHVILAIIMALYFMFTYITTTTVPSFPILQEKYGIDLAQVNWTVAIPALGLSLGPLVWASPADILGRRPIFIIGTLIALASTVGAALAPNYSGYAAARFFQGFGVSPASNVGLAIIDDIFFEHERGQKVGLWVLAIDLGLLVGPLIGGFVSTVGDEWIQWLCAILFVVILVLEVAFLPETLYPRRLMQARYESRGAINEKSPRNMETAVDDNGPRRTKSLALANVMPVPGVKHPKPWDTLIRFVKTFKYLVVTVSIMAYCFGWYWWVLSVVTLIPIAYPTFSPQSQGLLYIGLIVGTIVSEVLCSGRLSDWLIIQLVKRSDRPKTPEMRLWFAYPAAVLTAVGMIVWGVSVDKGYHWMVGQVALALFGAGIQMGNAAVCSYVFDAYPLQSMATMTFYAVMLNMSAFIDPFFIVPWVEDAGFTWTFAGHALITVFFSVPCLAAVHWFGGRLRERAGPPTWVNPEFSQGD
ncbi:MFS transporter [Emericellopsis cladophorae]|uniref:MFS transporter n=1 Tax=Emericellopsis cladophorae TaxID=2686198 RepID=A0A9P9XXL7_9HYPO|nr:MFS transporter [Emericellopsis cladophorae]KAI6779418.1 MFS transporter [Emericellopsis cladophorae]